MLQPPGRGVAGDALDAAVHMERRKARSFRRRFAVGHAFILMALFVPPLTLCVALSLNLHVAYFVGRSSSWVILVLLFVVLVFPMLHTWSWQPTGALLVSALLPCAAFLAVGVHYSSQTAVAIGSLQSRDCFGFDEKRDLQRAYQVALDLYSNCAAARADGVSVAECPGYMAASEQWGRQFLYLQTLETQFQCGGICHRGRRLWNQPLGYEKPSCSLFAAEWLDVAHVQSQLLLSFSVVVPPAAIVAVIVFLVPYVKVWYKPRAWPDS